MEKQRTFSKRKKVLMFCLISVFTLMCAGGGLIHWLNNERSSINATQNTDSTSYVMVDEIWNETEGYFNAGALNSLLQYITGNEDITANDITTAGSLGDMLATNSSYASNGALTSADIRDTQLAAGNTYTNDSSEVVGQDIQVTFGGLTWQVVYLTKDINGNDIVTLWLSNNYQEAWEGRSATEGTLYGFVNGALYSDWSADWSNGYAYDTDLYPSSMYSTSYIRTVVLNNEGSYATSKTAATSVTQSTDSVFAIYTMDKVAGSVKQYLVTPNQVKYQETENANTQFGNSNYYPNEAYGTPNGNGTWYTSNNENYDFSSREVYDDWAEDTLWLPSRTETGYSGTTGNSAGIWQTSTAQRANSTGSNSSMGSVGSTSGTAYNYSWLRSGTYNNAFNAYILAASGSNYTYNGVSNSYAVRPALHLNLNSAAKTTIPPTTWDGTSTEQPTLQNPAQANSEDNPYIIDSAAKLAYLSENYAWANKKYFLQTENLDLASHPWTPINNTTASMAYYYDGGGHTVSNLYINASEQTLASNDYLGLFGYVWGSSSKQAYIKNLGIVNGSIAGEGSYVGAVVGYAAYTDITNCYNEKTDITMTGTSEYVGGVVGRNYSGTISGSYNTGEITGTSYVGGVVGSNSYGTISGSYNTGTVTGSGNDVGGVVGYNSNGTISGSYNTGSVSGGNYVGGVAGGNYSGTISSSYNTGAVSGSNYVGGVAGHVIGSSSDKSLISSCFSTGAVTRTSGSSTYFGGVVGYIYNDTFNPSRYVSISWCYYNTETVGSVVTKAIGRGNGYQCYGLTTAQMQGDKNQNYMYLSDTIWNFASGSYPTLKYVATAQN